MKHKYIILLILLFFVLPANLGAQEKAYPKNGEGIELFLKRFNRTGSYYQKEFIRLNKSKLGRNNMLITGVKYTIPPLKEDEQPVKSELTSKRRKGYEPLFGKGLASYNVESNELKGACFYLDMADQIQELSGKWGIMNCMKMNTPTTLSSALPEI
jgi:N-acetylmuramoyl-L-alanine amidase